MAAGGYPERTPTTFCCGVSMSRFRTFDAVTRNFADTIAPLQSIRDGQTVVSAGGTFEFGFTNYGGSRTRYLGIWYKKISIRTVVWVANREIPLNDSSGVLQLTGQGILVVRDGTNSTIWTSKMSRDVQNPVAQLLDTGNLVVKAVGVDGKDRILWQSFDYIEDTFLPGMKFGRNLVTGLDKYLTSSKSSDDPSPGEYTSRLDPGGYPQIFLRRGDVKQLRSGPWNGLRFSGMANLKENPIYKFEFVYNEEEIVYMYQLIDSSVVTRVTLNRDGVLERWTWSDRAQVWSLYLTAQMDNCDRYALCGAYGSCNINNSPPCGCLRGFMPKYKHDWETGDWTGGCVRKTKVECGKGEGFQRIRSIKLPDTTYANLDIRDRGSGCLLWFSELIDIREYAEDGQDIYVRLAASDLDNSSSERRKWVRLIVIPVLVLGLVFLAIGFIVHMRKRKKLRGVGTTLLIQERDYIKKDGDQELELPLFDLAAIAEATNNFSDANKLGEGGYGPVYKGILKDGQQIAVKRPSKNSTQGLDEFKNEVLCIAKLQHRNLVKLLGCCIQVQEKMLIYEFMPNKSLDSFIFDQKQRTLLDWPRRLNIINGVARGLLYLHQDSRLRIIHRDLKVSNILLDQEMNPKISDFGMARSFGGNEIGASTKRVVGTYGYMSPEYAIDGLFSVKSDVFSFGVLVLEIVSGKRNRGFCHSDHKHNLLGHAWMLYKEGRPLDLIDDCISQSYVMSEVLRSIHVGLLCVQQSPEDRPTMAAVVLMLSTEIALPQPKEPGFFTERDLFATDSSSTKAESCSVNNMSITQLTAR
ncbi:hypothetical protein SLEP1_g26557 [Rubroshorea leprosula]|uniref:Receptor-like serine/threonine-protein kinase n=1 Tax=Rubroshorea leprosula TaxID=152421 RepID=A0AAV5JTH8_9ROSI|nr:hypothetical protein SLEP1_g26557 [Rubroshorea leprosula]